MDFEKIHALLVCRSDQKSMLFTAYEPWCCAAVQPDCAPSRAVLIWKTGPVAHCWVACTQAHEAITRCCFPAMTALAMEFMRRKGWPRPTLATFQLALVRTCPIATSLTWSLSRRRPPQCHARSPLFCCKVPQDHGAAELQLVGCELMVQAAMRLTRDQEDAIVVLYNECKADVSSAMVENSAVLAALSEPAPGGAEAPSAVIGGSLVSVF